MAAKFNFQAVPDSLAYRNGLPHVNWWAVFEHIRLTESIAEECGRRVSDAVDAWLDLLAGHLGDYALSDGEGFVVLHPAAKSAEGIIAVAESVGDLLTDVLELPEWNFLEDGEIVVLVFSRMEDRISYVDNYYSPDEDGQPEQVPLPDDMVIDDLIMQILTSPETAEQALPYLITVVAARELPLPIWLKIGLPYAVDRMFNDLPLLDLDEMSVHTCGAEDARNLFKAGDPDDESDPGLHHLSKLLMFQILGDHGSDALFAFIRDVDLHDGGEAAARKHFNMSLTDLAARFVS